MTTSKFYTLEMFIDKANIKHNNLYTYKNSIYTKSVVKLLITCKLHGDFLQEPRTHLEGHGCPKCAIAKDIIRRQNTFEDLVKRAKERFGDKYEYHKEGFVYFPETKKTYIEFTCKIHGRIKQRMDGHLDKDSIGCPRCGHIISKIPLKLTREEFIKRAKNKNKGKYDYSNVIFKDVETKVENIKCLKHGYFNQYSTAHLRGQGCIKCGIEKTASVRRYTTEQFIHLATKVHHGLYTYNNVDYVNSIKPVSVTCKIHGDFKVRPVSHIKPNGSGCKLCNSSKGELKISNFLNFNNVKYESEYVIPGYRYRYDFFIPELNLLIEYDGVQHFLPIKAFGGEKELEIVRARDDMKNFLAKKFGYWLIRIKYLDFDNLDIVLRKLLNRRTIYKKDGKLTVGFLNYCKLHNVKGDATPRDLEKYLFKFVCPS